MKNIKKLAVILLSGFILLNLVSAVNAYFPVGGDCNPGDIQDPNVDYPDCIPSTAPTQPATTPPAPAQPAQPIQPTYINFPPAGCPSGYEETFTLGAGKQICKLKGALTPGAFQVQESQGTLKSGELPGGQCSSIGYPVDVKGNCETGDTKIYCPESPTPYRCISPPPTSKVTGGVQAYKTQVPIPCQPLAGGTCPTTETPAGYIARLYQFGLMIVGLLAFGGIVFGSLKYILSAGNVGSQQDAKDQITQAILGLVLLLGAFLILYTINPDLVNLRNPKLEFINIEKIIGEGQVDTGGEQRLITAGGSRDTLCKLAVNANIGVSLSGQTAPTGQEIGEEGKAIQEGISGFQSAVSGQKTGSTCLSCKDNSSKDANGVCQCNNGYTQAGLDCVKTSEINPKDKPCADFGGICAYAPSEDAPGYYKGKCLSDPSKLYLCYKP